MTRKNALNEPAGTAGGDNSVLKEEAAAKFDAAMQAAVTELTLGIAVGRALAAMDPAVSTIDGEQAAVSRLAEVLAAMTQEIEKLQKQIEALRVKIASLNENNDSPGAGIKYHRSP